MSNIISEWLSAHGDPKLQKAIEDKLKNDMRKIYIVKYCGGDWDDYYTAVIFATNNINTAKEYVDRFNKILKKWKSYYRQFENEDEYIKDEHKQYFRRWYELREITECCYEEIEVR